MERANLESVSYKRARLIDMGRLNVVSAFLQDKPGLNLGSGVVRFPNKINVDNGSHTADIDVSWNLARIPFPFESDSQEEIVFTEVMEHLPAGSERSVIQEISRILAPGGLLVLSVPNNNIVSKLLDPIYWMGQHRHYTGAQLLSYLVGTDLEAQAVFSSGSIPWGVVTLSYAVNWLFRRKQADLFRKLVSNSFNKAMASQAGGTLFLVAKKRMRA